MADRTLLGELERRMRADPSSVAFANLAEQYRRAGRFDDAIITCRSGLTHHPGYVSARVTLGRALVAIGDLQRAEVELNDVQADAPDNLAAREGLAELQAAQAATPEGQPTGSEEAGEDTATAIRLKTSASASARIALLERFLAAARRRRDPGPGEGS
jgi:predicted Zn-dependent protease